MRTFFMILDLGRDFSKSIIVKAENAADAFVKTANYCKEEGYFPINISLIYQNEEIITLE